MSTDLAPLIKRYLELEERRSSIATEQDGIKAQIRAAAEIGKHETEAGTVTLSPNRRFDATLATEVLTKISPDLITACSVAKVDSAATKRLVGTAVYEQCCKDAGEPRVTFS